ncbi:hypothetical protein BMS3Bbin15_01392 [archaeon BMS3Bbin15]|nr:hypothetical protein BMS3Bbin15_01392 [archaeon BMS3Bbin15]
MTSIDKRGRERKGTEKQQLLEKKLIDKVAEEETKSS